MKTIIVWYRNDLRVHDHPALATAAEDADQVVPLFVLDDAILSDENASANRNRFLFECLSDLRASLQKLGSNLVIAPGPPQQTIIDLAKKFQVDAIYYTSDYTPRALKRDKAMKTILNGLGIEFRGFPGRLAVSGLDKISTKAGTPHKVFTPFWKNWQQIGRRDLADIPKKMNFPNDVTIGELPSVSMVANTTMLSPHVVKGGETIARSLLEAWLDDGIHDYAEQHNYLAENATSRLSPYLHFGCLSVREIETMLPQTSGANSWHRQLAWREFYNYVIFNFPDNKTKEFQVRYRGLKWDYDAELLKSWKDGQTGYPVVDAAMRQLKSEGWMHNRGRLIVGSFLTKDLGIDWREGEAHFMQWLLDGDTANNNGNWQWITSVGVDPAPVFRRLYNPSTQQQNHDPNGVYVRRFVPELKDVTDKYLSEPWKMPLDEQERVRCIIGKDYPAPVVDHAVARKAALERYRISSAT